eukprot:scaffold15277_cov34-Tisochrysis_lutea.AAC.1
MAILKLMVVGTRPAALILAKSPCTWSISPAYDAADIAVLYDITSGRTCVPSANIVSNSASARLGEPRAHADMRRL